MKNEERLIYCGPHLTSVRALDQFQITRTVSGCSLFIVGITTEDAGSYSCNVYLPEQSNTGFVRVTSNVFILDPVLLPPSNSTSEIICLETWVVAVGGVIFAVIIIVEAIIIGIICCMVCRRQRQTQDSSAPEEEQPLEGNPGNKISLTHWQRLHDCTFLMPTVIGNANGNTLYVNFEGMFYEFLQASFR